MKQISIFDIISPIMVGPSSSHTAGAIRLGLIAREIYGFLPQKVVFKLYNSYAQTGKGHGTDKGLLAGVLGLAVDDTQIKDIFTNDLAKTIDYSFEFCEDFKRHPNAVDIIFDGELKMKIAGDSIGGGEVRVKKINEFAVDLTGEYNTLILIYRDQPGVISKVSSIIQRQGINIASLTCDRSAKGEDASMCICLDSPLTEEISGIDNLYFCRQIKKMEI
ncbi:MAG: L-serine ammonia-lyase, iron-sulfur-dependent subunit beta [Spirochaetales bacterium]|nr:L-serine ammonia-lyase, iron-sulfur-dependent subunit beta [Spirochaetales bacterium]